MTDDEARADDRPRPWLGALQWALGITAMAAIIGGSFFLGRVTVPEPSDDSAAACTDARQAAAGILQEGKEWQVASEGPWTAVEEEDEEDADQVRNRAARWSNVIVQNPECFGAEERATAQTFLDDLNR